MSSTRAYVPATLAVLARVVATGELGPVPLRAHAVTAELRDDLSSAGEDEWEYAALSSASLDSIGMLSESDRACRVVIAVDAPGVLSLRGRKSSLVEISQVVTIAQIAAVHVDSEEAETDVAQARSKWLAEGRDSAGTEAAAARCLDHELGWYATQEIGDLISG